jgi:hypothetical protein
VYETLSLRQHQQSRLKGGIMSIIFGTLVSLQPQDNPHGPQQSPQTKSKFLKWLMARPKRSPRLGRTEIAPDETAERQSELWRWFQTPPF